MKKTTSDDQKYVLLIPDGMADEPLEELQGKTPLEAARTPNMDRLARTATVGFAQTVPEGMAAGSDVACMSLFGYDPKVYHTGRASLEAASQHIALEEKQVGGQLGRPSGARFRTYERLKNYAESVRDTLFDTEPLRRAINDIYRYPLRQATVDTLNRQLRSGISDEALAELVVALRDEDRLCVIHEEDERQEPRIICSLGLIDQEGN